MKVFHVILELAVHDDFECTYNQLVGKTSAHFGSLKRSKCALSFFSVLIFSSLQNCLHPAFSYVHLSAEEAGKVNRISTNFWVHFPAIFVVCFRKVNQISTNLLHFPLWFIRHREPTREFSMWFWNCRCMAILNVLIISCLIKRVHISKVLNCRNVHLDF